MTLRLNFLHMLISYYHFFSILSVLGFWRRILFWWMQRINENTSSIYSSPCSNPDQSCLTYCPSSFIHTLFSGEELKKKGEEKKKIKKNFLARRKEEKKKKQTNKKLSGIGWKNMKGKFSCLSPLLPTPINSVPLNTHTAQQTEWN